MRSRIARTTAVLAATALVLGAFTAMPADAKKKKKKKAASCAPFVPGAEGAGEAPVVRVTPKATEEKPIEVKIDAPPGIPEVLVQHVYANVQIVSAAATSLFARYEFPSYEDYDVFLLDGAGEEVARAAGFNPIPVGPFDGTGAGGHSEQGAEQIDGYAVTNCVGFTADLATYMGEGGELTLKLWLGEAPAPE